MKIFVFLLYIFAVGSCNDWLKSPYENNDDFNIKADFGDDIYLTCNDTRMIPPMTNEIYKWILPNLDVADKTYRKSYISLDGVVNITVEDDGKVLHISRVQEEHFGFYHCVGSRQSTGDFVIKRGLNYNGYYFGNLWTKYKRATTIGLSTSLPLMAVLLIALAVHSRITWNDEDIPIEMKNIPLHLQAGHEENGVLPSTLDDIINKQPVPTYYDNVSYEKDVKELPTEMTTF